MFQKIRRLSKKILTHGFKGSLTDKEHQQFNDLLLRLERSAKQVPFVTCNSGFEEFSSKIMNFLASLKTTGKFSYKYAFSTPQATIYGSAYACMLYFLLNKQNMLSWEDRKEWMAYFDSFQNDDGFFIDPLLEGDLYHKKDWWGAKHLSLHLIICYTYLGGLPKREFTYLKKYYDSDNMLKYLREFDFSNIMGRDDDNAIMNMGSLLQYQRDFFGDDKAGEALEVMLEELEKKINPQWGSWGDGDDNDIGFLSRTQQFSYHLYSLWFYDNRSVRNKENLIDLSLRLQTRLGGFGAYSNSSACEDMDCVDMLIKLSSLTSYRREAVTVALKEVLPWILANQNDDGGFVYRRDEAFVYGHELTSSHKNESNLFATWFRVLSIAYLQNYLSAKPLFNIGRCPGYHFEVHRGK